MAPVHALHYQPNSLRGDVVLIRQIEQRYAAGLVGRSNVPHITLGKRGGCDVLSPLDALWFRARTVPPLADHIARVVGWVSHEQVARVHAGRIVTGVANHLPVRDITMRNRVRGSMSQDAMVPLRRNSVPAIVASGLPLPAFVGGTNRNLFPKPILKRAAGAILRRTYTRARLAKANTGLPTRHSKGGSANRTNSGYVGRLTGHSLNLLHRFGGVVPRMVPAIAGFSCTHIIPEIGVVTGNSGASR